MAKEKIGVFSESDARAIARVIKQITSESVGNKTRPRMRSTQVFEVVLSRAPVGGIPARSGTTLGSVTTCNPINVDPITGVVTVDTSREFQCYNVSESVVGNSGDRYILTTGHNDGSFAIAPGGGGSLTECDALFSTLDTVEIETGDMPLMVRDGCLVLAEIRECDPASAAREAAFSDF